MINMMAITIKTIVSVPGDQYLAVKDMTSPRARADTKVPFRFPNPPTMTTEKLNSRTMDPIYGWIDVIGA